MLIDELPKLVVFILTSAIFTLCVICLLKLLKFTFRYLKETKTKIHVSRVTLYLLTFTIFIISMYVYEEIK